MPSASSITLRLAILREQTQPCTFAPQLLIDVEVAPPQRPRRRPPVPRSRTSVRSCADRSAAARTRPVGVSLLRAVVAASVTGGSAAGRDDETAAIEGCECHADGESGEQARKQIHSAVSDAVCALPKAKPCAQRGRCVRGAARSPYMSTHRRVLQPRYDRFTMVRKTKKQVGIFQKPGVGHLKSPAV